ncbi:hypothetical protein Bca101_068090 [Brassica carinata]
MATMSEKLEAAGGGMGNPFDDGIFDGVKRIIVGKSLLSVSYIKIEYYKDGDTQSGEHGQFTRRNKEFAVDYPDEYITAVGGTHQYDFKHQTTLIRSLFFKTSHGRTSATFGHKKSPMIPSVVSSAISSAVSPVVSYETDFMFESKNGGKLLGFHGRAGSLLNAIGPHFFAFNYYPLAHFNLEGGSEGNAWDDGAFDGVRKVVVGRSGKFVSYVRFEYAKGQRTVPHSHGKIDEATREFVVDYPNEHITLVEGTIDGKLTSLKFTTSKGRTSAFGNEDGRKFVFEKTGFKLAGFCGRSTNHIDALGAHFAPFPAPVPVPTLPYPLTPPNSVSKIYISAGYGGIGEIKFYNVENGQTKERFVHGLSTLVISNPPKEHLISLESWYDSSHVFQGIKFKTNKDGLDSLGYKFSEDDGTPFSVQIKDNMITGFHKLPYSNLNSPGTYFVLNGSSSSPNKLEALGGIDGETFDDGAFDNVRKVYVGLGDSYVAYLKFEYERKDGKGEAHEHGRKTVLGTEVFEVPKDDYITSVKVTYDRLSVLETEVITSVTFKTFGGITSPTFGEKGQEKGQASGNLFFLEGGKITGFHGSSSDVLHSLGAYVYRSPTRMLPGKWIEIMVREDGLRCHIFEFLRRIYSHS